MMGFSMPDKSPDEIANDDLRDPETGQFIKGHKGPGRNKGSRPKLIEAFWRDLHGAWVDKGAAAIDAMIEKTPGDFVRVVATQMPKELQISQSPLNDLSDEELADAIALIRASLPTASKPAGNGTEETTRH